MAKMLDSAEEFSMRLSEDALGCSTGEGYGKVVVPEIRQLLKLPKNTKKIEEVDNDQ